MALKDTLADLSHSTRGITLSCAVLLLFGAAVSGILSLLTESGPV